MPTSAKPINEADLQAFLEMAGRSLLGAQGELTPGINLQSDIMLASAELEAKVTLKTSSDGRLSVEPISSQELLKSNVNEGGISTVRVNFVSAATQVDPGKTFQQPVRKATEVAQEVRERADVVNLEKILGTLEVEAAYEPLTQRWLVTATDQKGRIVREAILPDETK